MSDYEKLLEKYNKLKEQKKTEIELLKEIERLKKIIKKLRKDNIELSILVKTKL